MLPSCLGAPPVRARAGSQTARVCQTRGTSALARTRLVAPNSEVSECLQSTEGRHTSEVTVIARTAGMSDPSARRTKRIRVIWDEHPESTGQCCGSHGGSEACISSVRRKSGQLRDGKLATLEAGRSQEFTIKALRRVTRPGLPNRNNRRGS